MVQYLKNWQRTEWTSLNDNVFFKKIHNVSYACNILTSLNHLLNFLNITEVSKSELSESRGIIKSREKGKRKFTDLMESLCHVPSNFSQQGRANPRLGICWLTEGSATHPQQKIWEKAGLNFFFLQGNLTNQRETEVLLNTGKFEDTHVFWKAQVFDKYLSPGE